MVPDKISGILTYKDPDKARPCLITSLAGFRVSILPRTTQGGADREPHPAHNGTCGYQTCRLDQPGNIRTELRSVDGSQLTDYSCREPNDDIIEWAMSLGVSERLSKKRMRR